MGIGFPLRPIFKHFRRKELFPNLRNEQSMISQIGKIVSTSDVDHSSTIPGDARLAFETLNTSKAARRFGVPILADPKKTAVKSY